MGAGQVRAGFCPNNFNPCLSIFTIEQAGRPLKDRFGFRLPPVTRVVRCSNTKQCERKLATRRQTGKISR